MFLIWSPSFGHQKSKNWQCSDFCLQWKPTWQHLTTISCTHSGLQGGTRKHKPPLLNKLLRILLLWGHCPSSSPGYDIKSKCAKLRQSACNEEVASCVTYWWVLDSFFVQNRAKHNLAQLIMSFCHTVILWHKIKMAQKSTVWVATDVNLKMLMEGQISSNRWIFKNKYEGRGVHLLSKN